MTRLSKDSSTSKDRPILAWFEGPFILNHYKGELYQMLEQATRLSSGQMNDEFNF